MATHFSILGWRIPWIEECGGLQSKGSQRVQHNWMTNTFTFYLLLRSKVMINLDTMFRSRDITLSTKVCIVKAMVFPAVMYRRENWTIKKTEHWRIDAFKLWRWRRCLTVPWTTRKSNHSILEGLMPKLKPQYFGHLIQRANSVAKTLMLGKIVGRQRMRRLEGILDSTDMSFCKLCEKVDREAWFAEVHGVTKSQTRLCSWTTRSNCT